MSGTASEKVTVRWMSEEETQQKSGATVLPVKGTASVSAGGQGGPCGSGRVGDGEHGGPEAHSNSGLDSV